jgi:nicotinamidase-related amidase
MTIHIGLDALLRPKDSIVLLIDHQAFQFANLHSHEPAMVLNNVVGLAKMATAFGVPTLLTTVLAERGGKLLPQLQNLFPEQEPIDRTTLNTWEDQRVADAVRAAGRKQLIVAGLYTEICLAMPVLQALRDGFEVTIVTDASGGVSKEAHNMAVLRMVNAGANPMTWMAVAAEWQRDWARTETLGGMASVLVDHGGGSGIAFLWEQQLLNTPAPSEATSAAA